MMSNKERNILAEYLADDVATDFLARAESDPDAARDALLVAAGYIRRGEAFPGNLADHLAGAIEAAMAKPEKHRAKALTDELNLTANNARLSGDWMTIGDDVERLIEGGSTQKKAFADIGLRYGISVSTVKRFWAKFVPLLAEFEADMKAALKKNHLEKVKRITR